MSLRQKNLIAYAFLLLLVTLAFVPSTLAALQLHRRAAHFVAAEGTITAKGMYIRRSRRRREKTCDFQYRFVVDGKEYSGRRLSLDSDDNRYSYMFRALPVCPHFSQVGAVTAAVRVMYNPRHPDESIIVGTLPFKRILNLLLIILAWVGLLLYARTLWP